MTQPTGPLPLADFGSPTLEVQHTAGHDDHPLESGTWPASEARLLAAMQRIGYLERQVEEWQAAAAEKDHQYQQLLELNNELLTHIDALQRPQPRRWFPFNW